MKRFEVGKTYRMVSPCDIECAWYYTVIKRTAMTVTLRDFTTPLMNGQEIKFDIA